jgi:hypothetical protein
MRMTSWNKIPITFRQIIYMYEKNEDEMSKALNIDMGEDNF